jgi:hypothetical protein
MSAAQYQVGDIVQCILSGWTLSSTVSQYYFIGHLRADTKNRVLVLATPTEVGIEIDVRHCRQTGSSSPSQGKDYRNRYARQRPGRLRSNV